MRLHFSPTRYWQTYARLLRQSKWRNSVGKQPLSHNVLDALSRIIQPTRFHPLIGPRATGLHTLRHSMRKAAGHSVCSSSSMSISTPARTCLVSRIIRASSSSGSRSTSSSEHLFSTRFGRMDTIILTYCPGSLSRSFSIAPLPCESKSSAKTFSRFSLSLLRAPFGLPAGLPL
jgi:hypothetical protein